MVKSQNLALSNDEHAMIFCHHHGIHFAAKGAGSAPVNDFATVVTCAIQLASAFVFTMLACISPFPLSIFCGVCAALVILFRFATVYLFFLSLYKGKYLRRFYFSSMVFWGWWPVLLLLFSCIFAICGLLIGHHLWNDLLDPYFQLKKLQMYRDINPAEVPGVRLQDAGLVDFQYFVGIDRGKGGCFLNSGDTYCVAPIVWDGTSTPEVHYSMKGLPQTGSYDYFAVGKNCCPCPNRDFHCGEWDNPLAYGGMRSLDFKARPYYQLALESWQASYGKTSRTPLFFEWVQGPEWKWKGLWNRFVQLIWLSIAGAVGFGLSIGFLLDKLLGALWNHDIISPRATFAPAPGYEYPTLLLLPKMFHRYNQEQAEIATMPISAEWHGERGPGSAQDDSAVAREYGATGSKGQNALGQVTGAAMASMMAAPGASIQYGHHGVI